MISKDVKQPKFVLFEGINNCGKTTLIKQFQKAYPKQIEVIKFPHHPDIVQQIEFLYDQVSSIVGIDEAELVTYLTTIHQLFDLDFRQFAAFDEEDLNPAKVYFLDRYYPSNLVYAGLHHIPINPYWMLGHSIRPNVNILLEVRDGKKYLKDFPVVDNYITMDVGNAIQTKVQLLTAENLFLHGQQFYHEAFASQIKMGNMDNYHTVDALEDDTFRQVEKILMRNEIL